MKKKRIIFAASVTFITVSMMLFATPKYFNEHKKRKRNNVTVVKNCKFCHNKNTGLKKRGGQNYKLIQKSKTCSGRECHGI